MEVRRNFYSNPAFCQQSEYSNTKSPRALSPQGSIRQSPVGAQTIPRILDTSVDTNSSFPEEVGLQEQEFYEEVVVDHEGYITEKKFVVIAQNNEGRKYIKVPQSPVKCDENLIRQDDDGSMIVKQYNRAEIKKPQLRRSMSERYEYIQMKEKVRERVKSPRTSPQRIPQREVFSQGRVRSYSVLDAEEETEIDNNIRYALVPFQQLNKMVNLNNPPQNRYSYKDEQSHNIPQSPIRYNLNSTSPQKNLSRFDYTTRQYPRVSNPIATQKLYELLSTPRKISSPHRQFLTPQPKRRTTPSNAFSPISRESFRSTTATKQAPRAQQKLNYALNSKQLMTPEKRHTAVVAPICSSPIQSVYSETTYSNKSESWMNLSVKKDSVQITLIVAALIMFTCGSINAALCFYMISQDIRRQYFLDLAIVSGFTCLVLSILGCRTRNVYWLPNRNYISGN